MTMRRQAAKTLLVPLCLALTLSGCGSADDVPPATGPASNLPVIANPEEDNGYPSAEVSGLLELRNGCLILGGDVVFWPYRATWDADAQAVVFRDAPQFEDAAPATVGAVFTGGGGFYPADTDFRAWRGAEFADPIEKCQTATNTKNVVFAYPARS